MMDKIIDLKTGELNLNISKKVGSSSTKSDLLNCNLGSIPNEVSYGNGWGWLFYDNIILDGQMFSIGFSFFNDLLKSIQINFSEHLRHIKENSDNWTEKNELLRMDKYDEFLTRQIGKQRDFDWGYIVASYHPKDGISNIILRYNND